MTRLEFQLVIVRQLLAGLDVDLDARHEWSMSEAVMRAAHHGVTNEDVYTTTRAFLEQHAKKRPFFAFVHLWDVHYDYEPPAAHDVFYPGYRGPIDGRGFMTGALNGGTAVIFDGNASGNTVAGNYFGTDGTAWLGAGGVLWPAGRSRLLGISGARAPRILDLAESEPGLARALASWIARHPDDGRFILTNGYDWTYFTVEKIVGLHHTWFVYRGPEATRDW